MTLRLVVLVVLLLGSIETASGEALEKQVYEQRFGDWTAVVIKDLVLNRNKCRIGTSDAGDSHDSGGDSGGGSGGEADIATFRFNKIRRAHTTTWSGAAYLPQIVEKSEIVLTIDGTVSRDLKSEFVSTSTVYLGNDFSVALMRDFFTGELLGESLTIRYQDTSGAARAAKMSLEGFADAKKSLESKCASL